MERAADYGADWLVLGPSEVADGELGGADGTHGAAPFLARLSSSCFPVKLDPAVGLGIVECTTTTGEVEGGECQWGSRECNKTD